MVRDRPGGGAMEARRTTSSVLDAILLRSVQGLGDRAFRCLVDAFGSPGAVLGAPEGALRRAGASPLLAARIRAAVNRRARAEAEAARARRLNVEILHYGGPGYPEPLTHLADPPPVLYAAGNTRTLHRPAVAVVGSREATEFGLRFAYRLGRDLAERGIAVVSGMARGIDSAAHEGALAAGGPTVAVLGWGLDTVPPGWRRPLARKIRSMGVLLSEFPFGTPAMPGHFPRRNRLISGLSLGVVVVEAAARSGSLITARHALDQGREVFAVPGRPGDENARGTLSLIKQGAKPVESVDDILEELPVGHAPPARAGGEPGVPSGLARLWEALGTEPRHIDEVAVRAGMSPAEAAAGLMELTLRGCVQEWPGKRYSRG